MFGHAYEAWQGADQSQGMENFLQNYNFDLMPTMPGGFKPYDSSSGLPPLQQIAQQHQDFTNTPEYQAWQQREEGRGPLSQSTIQAMGGMQSSSPIPDINPYISMGLGSMEETPTYEGYMNMVNRGRESYRPQSTATSPAQNPFTISMAGNVQRQQRVMDATRPQQAGISALAGMAGEGYQPGIQQEFIRPYNDPSLMAAGIAGQPSGIQQLQPYSQALQAGVGALQGPTQQKIKGYMT